MNGKRQHIEYKTTLPNWDFYVSYDCSKLTIAIEADSFVLPPNIKQKPNITFKRKTIECGHEPGRWCTKERWKIYADWTVWSDLDRNNKWDFKDLELAEVSCDCVCVEIVGHTISIEGHDIESSGLRGPSQDIIFTALVTGAIGHNAGGLTGGDQYYTDYMVQYSATIDGKEWISWTQAQRIEGRRSWYGYSYSRTFYIEVADDLEKFYQELANDKVFPPGYPREKLTS